MKDYNQISNDFQQKVLKNKDKYPLNVYLAVKRQQKDLKTKDFDYYYSESAGVKVCYFIENLKHVKGKWANKLFILEPWQVFFLMTLFSWLKRKNDRRRFSQAILMIPRKNGKSLMGAAIGMYMLIADGEYGAEIYCGANSLKQAQYIFDPARKMVMNNDPLKKAYDILPNKETIFCVDTNSTFEPVIKNVRDGSSPHCAIVDELHESESTHMIDAFQTGMGSRDNPLLLITSTAGINISSPCFDIQQNLEKVLNGLVKDEAIFGLIYNKDDGDNWKYLKTWKKVNPNYGVSINSDYLKKQLKDAKQYPSKRNILRTKHLNEWRNVGEAWIDLEKFIKCKDESLRIEDFKGLTCYLAIDLASKIDLATTVKVFPLNDKYYVFTKNYMPSDTINKPENDHYQKWRDNNQLIETPGVRTDYGFLEEQILDDMKEFQVAEIIFDPFQATYIIQRLQEAIGDDSETDLIEFAQSASHMNEPLQEFEAAYMNRELVYGIDPILEWAASNVIVKNIRNKLWTIGKATEKNKIDPVVALIMAFGRALSLTGNTDSVYETRGLLII